MVAWTPADDIGLKDLWDSTAGVQGTTTVLDWASQWGRRSRLAHATDGPDNSTETINTDAVLNFDGTEYLELDSYSLPGSGNCAFFVLAEIDAVSNSGDSVISVNAADEDFELQAGHATEFHSDVASSGLGLAASQPQDGVDTSTAWHLYCVTFDFVSGDVALYIDGTLQDTESGSYTTKLNGTVSIRIMTDRAETQDLDGKIRFVGVTENVSAYNRQAWEGYLMHTAGDATEDFPAKLPATHPYVDTAPTTLLSPQVPGVTMHAWWDGRDVDQITTETGVSSWVSKGDNAWDLLQATAADQPEWDKEFGFLNFVDTSDVLTTASISPALGAISDASVFILGSWRDPTRTITLHDPGGTRYLAYLFAGNGSAPHFNTGTPTTYVNGNQLSADTRDALFNAVTLTGVDSIIEQRGVDFSASPWTVIELSGDSADEMDGRIYQIIIMDALTDAQANDVQLFLESVLPSTRLDQGAVPYINLAATGSTTDDPTDIDGLTTLAWLDGRDLKSMAYGTDLTLDTWTTKGDNAWVFNDADAKPDVDKARNLLSFQTSDASISLSQDTAALTDVDVFILGFWGQSGHAAQLVFNQTGSGAKWFARTDTSASSPDNSSGSPAYHIDGNTTALAGPTQTELQAALVDGQVHILEVRGVDFSGWTGDTIQIGGYASYEFAGNIYQVIFADGSTITDAARLEVIAYLEACKQPQVFSPLEIPGITTYAWWDLRDTDKVSVETGIDSITAKGDNTWAIANTTDAEQPSWFRDANLNFALLDGADDQLGVSAPSGLTSITDASVWFALRINKNDANDRGQLLVEHPTTATDYLGYYRATHTSFGPDVGSGTPTYFIDGVQLSADNRHALYEAIQDGLDHVVEVRNVTFASWGGLYVSSNSASLFEWGGRLYQLAITDAADGWTQSQRDAMLAFMQSKFSSGRLDQGAVPLRLPNFVDFDAAAAAASGSVPIYFYHHSHHNRAG